MTHATQLRINPNLDLTPFVEAYRRRSLVQIPDIFEPATAGAIRSMLAGSLSWRLLMTDDDNKPVHFSEDEWKSFDEEKRARIMENVQERAQKNLGFNYFTYPMIEAYLKGWDKGHPIHQITELINSSDFLGLGRTVTGVAGINKADAHACKYAAGHYLTRHLDFGEDRERRAAYVLGFTKNWQPDWGGLLLFLKDNQDVDFGFLPRFNNLTIFDIKYLHTVTQVSTFAGAPRLTITGWFRDDPIPTRR